MPYVSDRQRRFFHTDTARKAGITPEQVAEFDEASKGMKLPERKESKKHEASERKRKVIDSAIRGHKK